MAYEQKTRPSDASVVEFLRSAEPARRRDDGLRLLDMFCEETGAEPRLWRPSIVGFGHERYTYATGHSGEMMRVGFSPRKAALTLYGLTLYGNNADLLARLGKHRVGKGCLYVTKLEDVDLDVLRELIRRGWLMARRSPTRIRAPRSSRSTLPRFCPPTDLRPGRLGASDPLARTSLSGPKAGCACDHDRVTHSDATSDPVEIRAAPGR